MIYCKFSATVEGKCIFIEDIHTNTLVKNTNIFIDEKTILTMFTFNNFCQPSKRRVNVLNEHHCIVPFQLDERRDWGRVTTFQRGTSFHL